MAQRQVARQSDLIASLEEDLLSAGGPCASLPQHLGRFEFGYQTQGTLISICALNPAPYTCQGSVAAFQCTFSEEAAALALQLKGWSLEDDLAYVEHASAAVEALQRFNQYHESHTPVQARPEW